MATVTGLAGHLLTLLQPVNSFEATAGANSLQMPPPSPPAGTAVPKVDAARLAFYHFLKNMCEPGEPLSTATLDRFFRRAMTHAHWVENKAALFDEVANCLQHFSNQNSEPIPLPPFATAAELQIVRAESFRTVERVVEDWIQTQQGPTDQVKILRDRANPARPDSDDRLIVCKLNIDRALSVYTFDRLLALREGRLEPLVDDMVIHYTSELAIEGHRFSQVEIGPHTIARFKNDTIATSPGIRGLAVRGFTFQKSVSFEGGDLHRHPLLFYPLKRIEQFFVNRQTDPLYIELTGLLEKASDLLSQKHPESVRFAEAAMERGRLAFEQVFNDDRLLRLLLENLERALQLERRPLSSALADASSLGVGPLGPSPAVMDVEFASELGDKLGNHLGLRLKPGEEFIEPIGPDLVELQETRFQEAEACETIAPVNLRAP
jgi:hypothetical protein